METNDLKMRQLKLQRDGYELALTRPADIKQSFGVNMLFQSSCGRIDFPNEEVFDLGIKLIILASKEGEKYAFSKGAYYFTSENKYGKGLNLDKVLQIYQTGAQNGDKYSYFKLGDIYRCGLYDVNIDFEKVLTYYTDGAKLESEECQFMLAKIYWLWHKDFEIGQNIDFAKEMLEKSYKNGYLEAKAWLGLLYIEQLNEAQKGYELLAEAVGEGSSDAYVAMGNLFEEGTVVEKDYEKAVQYYKLAAQYDNYFGKKICKEKKIDYHVRFTSMPRIILYSEPQNCDGLEWKSIVENGITYECFTSADSESVFEECYSRILNVIENKYSTEFENKILEFTTLENIFYSIGKLVYEIENGGLEQYFYNSNFIRINGLLRALNDVGAQESFKVIAACQKFVENADEDYYMRKEKKLKENLKYYVLDYMLENFPKELVL